MNTKVTCLLAMIAAFYIVGSVTAYPPPPPPPTAALKVWPNNNDTTSIYVMKDKKILLDGSASVSNDGQDIILYEWDWTNNGTYDYMETSVVHTDGAFDKCAWHIYNSTGTFTAKLRVRDSHGSTDTMTASINVSVDTNTNGLPDAWETAYGITTGPTANDDNPDGGYDNLCEYLHGSDPTDGGDNPAAGIIAAYDDTVETAIQDAIDASVFGDTILVLPGTYTENITFNTPGCVLRSMDPGNWELVNRTIIHASSAGSPVVEISGTGISNTTIVEGFTITGGSAGIACSDSSPAIRKCVIKENSNNGSVSGGIYLDGSYNSQDTVVSNCFIIDNNSIYSYRCGGINNVGGSELTVNSCVFYGNSGSGGGAVRNDSDSSVTLKNCTIVKNVGGGPAYPGGLVNDYGGSATLNNTILCLNQAVFSQWYGDIGGTNFYIYPDIDEDYPDFADIYAPAGNDGIYGTRDDGLRLDINSPCIDLADGNYAPLNEDSTLAADITGQSRNVDIPTKSGGSGTPAYVDIGAYELNRIWFVENGGSGTSNSWGWGNACTLQYALSHTASGDEIWVAADTYKPGASASDTFQLSEGVAMYGGFTGTETDFAERMQSNTTVLSGDIDDNGQPNSGDCYTVVTGAAGALLDRFIITCGWSTNYFKGGGITNTSGSMSVRNCFMVDNYVYYRGGGLYSSMGSMQMVNCVVANNDAHYYAGGIYLNSALPAEILNCTIVDNSADAGVGGVGNYSATFIENSILCDNVVGQTASNLGGVSPGISHCDIEGCGGSGANWNTSFGIDDGGNIDADPYFVNSSDLDGTDDEFGTRDDGLQLDDDPLSPCIDTGDNDIIHELWDITGWHRKRDGNVDMGAYEYISDYCNGIYILDVEYDESGITDSENYGWQNEILTTDCGESFVISDTFMVENAANQGCGGNNSKTQQGFCHIVLYLSEQKSVTLSVEGNVEMHNKNFDYGGIYITDSSDRPYDFDDHYDTADVSVISVHDTK